MSLPVRIVAAVALLCTSTAMLAEAACAQEIQFDRIDRFESVGTGTLHGAPSKTTRPLVSFASPAEPKMTYRLWWDALMWINPASRAAFHFKLPLSILGP
jgi:hypothetical protein